MDDNDEKEEQLVWLIQANKRWYYVGNLDYLLDH